MRPVDLLHTVKVVQKLRRRLCGGREASIFYARLAGYDRTTHTSAKARDCPHCGGFDDVLNPFLIKRFTPGPYSLNGGLDGFGPTPRKATGSRRSNDSGDFSKTPRDSDLASQETETKHVPEPICSGGGQGGSPSAAEIVSVQFPSVLLSLLHRVRVNATALLNHRIRADGGSGTDGGGDLFDSEFLGFGGDNAFGC